MRQLNTLELSDGIFNQPKLDFLEIVVNYALQLESTGL